VDCFESPFRCEDAMTTSARALRIPCVLMAALAAACSAATEPPEDGEDVARTSQLPPGETQPEGTTLDAVFQSAGAEFGVPVPLLKGIAWAETRWEMVRGEAELDGLAPAYGVMALRGDRLEEGAALARVTVDEAKVDMASNVRAGAAVLGARAVELGVPAGDLGAWAEVAADYSGTDDVAARAYYVHAQVYRSIQQGLASEIATLDPIEVTPDFYALDSSSGPGPDYAGSVYHPSPNHSARPGGSSGKPQMVIIHTCEGSYAGCWGWLTNSSSGVSAHYVVSADGSEISQLVRENRKAWHIAATYDCDLNGGTSCGLEGVSSNSFTIGIEHAGYASQSAWSSGLLDASAALTCDVTRDQGIPRDKFHIVGHGQLQPYNRVDPGANWPWTQYLSLVSQHCDGSAPPPPPAEPEEPSSPAEPGAGATTIIVDNNNAKNGPDAQCVVGGNWTPSNNVSGYYATGYYWRSTGESSDLAEFRVRLAAAKRMRVEARWPAAGDRSKEAPFIVYGANGDQLGLVKVNQQKNGGAWVDLGTYDLGAGWNVVALSRWTTPGYVVIADAVRFTEVP
jgi:N-acetyl-anhydromuramyl-L-alanine amidase AmpD